ncbi:hypothetical protein [Aerolutibacter ruishenii]|uniref:Uncharacterized protein n=1 Tax=Aerolutibacter ruishenii TaxID=686800 RepID=A0A562M1P6_9GAMM|nr:hypothetical protein [Lysobacter ruishenii]TWI13531.1 hypothetical protein IP93_00693 [Lysobacter ruishenii]
MTLDRGAPLAHDFNGAWIHGGTLRKVLKNDRPSFDFGPFKSRDRVDVRLPDSRYALRWDTDHGVPFALADGLFVTVHDEESPSTVYELPTLRFTRRALLSASAAVEDDPTTINLAERAHRLASGDANTAWEFSKAVCEWGDGERVWGKLKSRHGSKLGALLAGWFSEALDAPTPSRAIAGGLALGGFGVSFASKHLRHLRPDRYAVLDDIVEQGLGYARSPTGYDLFIHDLRRLQFEHFPDLTVAAIEAGLFGLARQLVRSR